MGGGVLRSPFYFARLFAKTFKNVKSFKVKVGDSAKMLLPRRPAMSNDTSTELSLGEEWCPPFLSFIGFSGESKAAL